jgi:glycine cleavage system aminomethyltransferase T
VSLETEVSAIRSSVGLSRADQVAVVRVGGPGALDFLQTASTQSPYVREGRVRHTLLLRDDASVFADAFIVKVEEDFLVLAEGPSEQELVAWLSSPKADEVTTRGMQADWVAFGLDGPYAWELLSGVFGPVVLGMPYLSLLRRDDVLCVRAGKTGEYGYLLLVPRPAAAELEKKLLEAGGPLDVATVGCEALDVCALENWHFSMRNLRDVDRATLTPTPIELQLQWRVVYTREFRGAEALRARRAEGPKARATCFTADKPVAAGQRLRLGDLDVGEVMVARASPTLGAIVGAALLDLRFAHPHLTLSAGAATVRTCTASLVDNLSLHVQPHKHSYATRNAEPAAP